MALEVLNRSSLSAALSDDIRRNLLTQLAVTGVRFVAAEQAAVNVRVTLSEDLQSYVWVAEIRQGANAPSVVMVSLPRSAALAVEPAAAAMVLREVSLWSQTERILDVAVIEDNPARMLVLDANGVIVLPDAGESLADRTSTSHCSFAAVAARSARKAGWRGRQRSSFRCLLARHLLSRFRGRLPGHDLLRE